MEADTKQILKAFMLRWSTTTLTKEARQLLIEDIASTTAILDALGADTTIIEQANNAHNRQWFAQQHQKLSK